MVETYEGGIEEIRSLDLTGDGKYLIVQGIESEVAVYDISTTKKLTGDKKNKRFEVIRYKRWKEKYVWYGFFRYGFFRYT